MKSSIKDELWLHSVAQLGYSCEVHFKGQGSTLQQSHPSSAYHYRSTESEIAFRVTIQSTNQWTQWGKDHNVNFGTRGCVRLMASFLQTAKPCVIFQIRLLDPVNQNNVSTHIVLGQQPGVTFKMSVFAEIHMTFASERSTSAIGPSAHRGTGKVSLM